MLFCAPAITFKILTHAELESIVFEYALFRNAGSICAQSITETSITAGASERNDGFDPNSQGQLRITSSASKKTVMIATLAPKTMRRIRGIRVMSSHRFK